MNAKNELLDKIKGKTDIKCAVITYGYQWHEEKPIPKIMLSVNHTTEEYSNFLQSLDFEYDNGYGGQELFGTVWLKDGTWLSRGEYNGSEWWNHNILPNIPEYLT